MRLVPADKPLFRRKAFFCAAISVIILAVSYLYPWYARTSISSVSTCWFHRLTGLPCFLCGMTRSLAAAARLHIGDSFYFHLLGPFLFLALVLLLPGSLALLATNRRLEFNMPHGTVKLLLWFLFLALATAWALKLLFFGINV